MMNIRQVIVTVLCLGCALLNSAMAHKKVVVIPLAGDDVADPVTINVAEDAGIITFALNRSGGSEGQLSISVKTIDGSAKNGQDYAGLATPLVLTWADGNINKKTITLPIFRDNLLEGDETFRMQLSSANPDWVNSRNEVSVVIEDIAPGKIQFELDSYSINESAGSVVLTLERLGGDEGEINVDVHTFDGTARDGFDYSGLPGPLRIYWPDGDTSSKTITLPIISDGVSEPVENFSIEVSSTNPDWVSTQDTAVVSIRDSNISLLRRGKIRVSSPTYQSSEGGVVVIELERIAGSFGTMTADVRTVDGTAKNGQDYSGITVPQTLTWGPGNTTTKTITLPIASDTLAEGKETFTLNITGVNIGFPSTTSVTIKNTPTGQISIGEN